MIPTHRRDLIAEKMIQPTPGRTRWSEKPLWLWLSIQPKLYCCMMGSVSGQIQRGQLKTGAIACFLVRDSKRLKAYILMTVPKTTPKQLSLTQRPSSRECHKRCTASRYDLASCTPNCISTPLGRFYRRKILSPDGMMNYGVDSRRMSHEILNDSRVVKLSIIYSFTACLSTYSH